MKRIAYIAGLICLLIACSERREYTVALSRAVTNNHPDSALVILDSLGRHEPHFGNVTSATLAAVGRSREEL